MKRVLQTIVILGALAGIAGASVVGFGLYNVSARQGHWPGVKWVLHTTYKQSVRLRSPAASEIPDDLADPDRVALGALHFKGACSFCHAVPGQLQSATAQSLNPGPPHVVEAVSRWEPQHMFWIVREGVKMSGMPYWPARDRDDEVWSVVAYLEAVRDMTAEDQVALTGGEPGAASCSACHGEEGRSTNSYVPRLDILKPDYIGEALEHYRNGTRRSGIMQQVALGLDDETIDRVASKFGKDVAANRVNAARQDNETQGYILANQGTKDVPACSSCHGPNRTADAPIAPSLEGQSQGFLVTQLKLWRDGKRNDGKRAEQMLKAAQDLSDKEIKILAEWYAGQ
ncbi:hypothetical protein LCGC14_0334070 [marine sediment metagenome]|uniref:Cytochrome c domain-containing protein n=1 Tax=marine sediment metagenome TaxID=412755 RepID=A0A0F9TL54_9ZZZZ|tara:strand:+ start:534 stop:1559 length:1026 start_codon:yes stop_codon:yes gene_type:complete